MRRTLTLGVVAFAVMIAAARPAAAQVYPDRISSKVHSRIALYQRRTDEREQQTERFTKTLALGPNGELIVENIAGDIVITRGGGGEATIEVVKTARGRSVDDAKELLQLVQVDVIDRNRRGEVRARYPDDQSIWRNHRNINVSVAYNIAAPAGTRITAKSISGNIKVADIKGELSLETISGDVRIASGGRVANAKSVSGNVEISDTQADGPLDVSSISGDVTLTRVAARRLGVNSVSGNVRLTEVQSDRIDAQSISGNVDYSGALARGARFDLKSHSGEVRLVLAGNTGFEVEATSFSGDVRSDFPITTRGNAGTMDEAGRRRRRTTLSGTFGDGSAVLQLTTFSGGIVITKR